MARRVTQDDKDDFAGFLRNATDNQVRNIYMDEKKTGRHVYTHLAELEAARRGIDL